jgi:hypothetical protein
MKSPQSICRSKRDRISKEIPAGKSRRFGASQLHQLIETTNNSRNEEAEMFEISFSAIPSNKENVKVHILPIFPRIIWRSNFIQTIFHAKDNFGVFFRPFEFGLGRRGSN